MSDENKSRRCSFELFPDERTGDKIADETSLQMKKLEGAGTFHARDVSYWCGVCSYR